jgi:hypothetical protein
LCRVVVVPRCLVRLFVCTSCVSLDDLLLAVPRWSLGDYFAWNDYLVVIFLLLNEKRAQACS